MATYKDEWKIAIARTRRFGMQVPEHEIDIERRWLDTKAVANIETVMRDALGAIPSQDEVVLQCISIHYRLRKAFQRNLGCPAMFTIGWVDDGTPKGMFRFDDAFIEDKLAHGYPSTEVCMHAWLTLPSMEIIDVSLLTSIGEVLNITEYMGGVIARKADELINMKYKPMLVGLDFLYKTGMI